MRTNVGRTDTCIRGVLAIAFLILAAVFHDLVTLSLVTLLLALLCAGTALTRNCPLYALLRITTVVDRSHPSHS
jgi:hypothetical protein